MKLNQYCSVCKQHLDMEVIPTDDAGDDGVIWLRCPQCQGFLPKFSGDGPKPARPAKTEAGGGAPALPAMDRDGTSAKDSPADAADGSAGAAAPGGPSRTRPSAPPVAGDEPGAADEAAAPGAAGAPAEPIAEYAAMLAAADLARARPYRATSTFAVGDVIHHLAYGDVGIVVAKERLPGGRRAVKVYFEAAGVVHLIEQATADGR